MLELFQYSACIFLHFHPRFKCHIYFIVAHFPYLILIILTIYFFITIIITFLHITSFSYFKVQSYVCANVLYLCNSANFVRVLIVNLFFMHPPSFSLSLLSLLPPHSSRSSSFLFRARI